ncbi:hypothetical protein QM012_008654 [Aureobasidium pullulans]|uniref:Wax synthase domain-containing protein n=1 Tax=Aureobasidium pullulans TaxID=5580 RepID=A0ABR0TKW7_AURPU
MQAPIELRTSQFIAGSCMTLLLPAAYAITRPGLVTSTYERVRLIVVLGLKGLLAPLWVLFEAVADLIIALLIASKVNKLAQDCHSAGQRAAQNNQERPLLETPDYRELRLEIDGRVVRHFFPKWTLLHGHFARQGGFQVPVSPESSSSEPLGKPDLACLRPQYILDILRNPKNPCAGRFDLLADATKDAITTVVDTDKISDALCLARLSAFLYFVIRRACMGLETSEIEIIAVGHIFLTFCIQLMWWNKPKFIRRPGITLDRRTLNKLTPELVYELQQIVSGAKVVNGDHSTLDQLNAEPLDELQQIAPGAKVAPAYPLTLVGRFGLRRWYQQDDDHIDLRIHATLRNIAVFGLATMHAGVMILPQWRLQHTNSIQWCVWLIPIVVSMAISIIILVLFILDFIGRKISERSDRFGRFWGAELCERKPIWNPGFAAKVRRFVHDNFPRLAGLHAVLMSFSMCYALGRLYIDPSAGALVKGSGDVFCANSTLA